MEKFTDLISPKELGAQQKENDRNQKDLTRLQGERTRLQEKLDDSNKKLSELDNIEQKARAERRELILEEKDSPEQDRIISETAQKTDRLHDASQALNEALLSKDRGIEVLQASIKSSTGKLNKDILQAELYAVLDEYNTKAEEFTAIVMRLNELKQKTGFNSEHFLFNTNGKNALYAIPKFLIDEKAAKNPAEKYFYHEQIKQ